MEVVEYQRLTNRMVEGQPVHEACLKEEATHFIAQATTEDEWKEYKGRFKRFDIKFLTTKKQ